MSACFPVSNSFALWHAAAVHSTRRARALSASFPANSTGVIDIALELAGTGWLGFGIGSSMFDADIVLLRVVDGVGEIQCAHSVGEGTPTADATCNVQLVSAEEVGGKCSYVIR